VLLDSKASEETQEVLVPLAVMDVMAVQVQLETQVNKVRVAIPEALAPLVERVSLDLLGRLDELAKLVPLDK
jgi:hypothetical protein